MYNGIYYNYSIMGSGLKLSASIFERNVLKVSRTHICEMIECSFSLSAVGLVISLVLNVHSLFLLSD